MLEIAAPAHIPRAQRHLVPSRWRWLSWVRWLLAAGGDGVARSSRLRLEAWRSDAAAGEPSPAHSVDMLFQEHARAALNAYTSGQTLTGGWLMVTAQRRIADFYRRRQRALPVAATDAADEQQAGVAAAGAGLVYVFRCVRRRRSRARQA